MSLRDKIKKAQEVLKKARRRFGSKAAVAWTGGKDSTVILHLARTTFDDSVPFPVFFNDSTMEFAEVYRFIDDLSKKWGLEVIRVKHLADELKEFRAAEVERKKELARTMKISAINHALKKYRWEALITGIRWDEHESRSKEKHFSSRKMHMRVHPILQFTEKDIWDYIKKFKVPYVKLYDQGYRSLGEAPFTRPATGKSERSGRDHDKELVMKRLRALGYY